MKYQSEYKKIIKELDNLIGSCKQDIIRIEDKINEKILQKSGVNLIVILSKEQEAVYEKKSNVLKTEITQNQEILDEMKKVKDSLIKLKESVTNEDGTFLKVVEALKEAKPNICSLENKTLFSKHSEGYDFFSKIFAFLNSIFTKTIGEKELNKIDQGLNKATSIAEKLELQGIFRVNGNVEKHEIPVPKGPSYNGL